MKELGEIEKLGNNEEDRLEMENAIAELKDLIEISDRKIEKQLGGKEITGIA